jgi:hypothetical protein
MTITSERGGQGALPQQAGRSRGSHGGALRLPGDGPRLQARLRLLAPGRHRRHMADDQLLLQSRQRLHDRLTPTKAQEVLQPLAAPELCPKTHSERLRVDI